MRSDKLNRTLSRVHRPRVGIDTGHRQRLEDELLSRHGRLYARKGWKMLINPRFPVGRLVTACLLICVLGIAACTIPTSVEEEAGKNLTITLPEGVAGAPSPGDLLAAMRDAGLGGQVSVNTMELQSGGTTYELAMLDRDIDAGHVAHMLRERFPALREAKFETHGLVGTVETSLAEKIGHHVFHFKLHHAHQEDLNEFVQQQLIAQGFEGHVETHVHRDGDEELIEFQIQSDQASTIELHVEGSPDGAAATGTVTEEHVDGD